MKRIYLFFIAGFLLLLYATTGFVQEKKNKSKRDPFVSLIKEDGHLRTDFTKPSFSPSTEIAGKVSLTGITEIEGKFYALIDGQLVREGDLFRDLIVEKIEANRVILSLGEKKIELRLEKERK